MEGTVDKQVSGDSTTMNVGRDGGWVKQGWMGEPGSGLSIQRRVFLQLPPR